MFRNTKIVSGLPPLPESHWGGSGGGAGPPRRTETSLDLKILVFPAALLTYSKTLNDRTGANNEYGGGPGGPGRGFGGSGGVSLYVGSSSGLPLVLLP